MNRIFDSRESPIGWIQLYKNICNASKCHIKTHARSKICCWSTWSLSIMVKYPSRFLSDLCWRDFLKKCPEQKKSTECSKSFFEKRYYVCTGKTDLKLLHTLKVFFCPSAIAKNNYIYRETYVAVTMYKGNYTVISMFAVLWIF